MKHTTRAAIAAALLCGATQAQVSSANDTCATAAGPFTDGQVSIDTTGATASGQLASGLPPWTSNLVPDTACQDFNGMPDNLNSDTFLTFNPATNGDYILSTCNNSAYDSKLAIYSGACGSLTALSCNDDGQGCAAFSSELLVSGLSMGTSYTVQVGGFGAADAGTAFLDMQPGSTMVVANNECATAEAIMGDGGFPFDTTMATSTMFTNNALCDPPPGIAGDGILWNDVFFAWTATSSGTATVVVNSIGYDSKLAIYDTDDCNTAALVECDDQFLADGGDTVMASVTSGNTYLISIGGWQEGITGAGTIDITTSGVAGLGVNTCITAPNSNDPVGAIMSASGSTSVMANDLVLIATGGSVTQPGIMYYGSVSLAGIAFGEGFRCAGGTTVRLLPPVVSDGSGTFTKNVDNTIPLVTGSLAPIVDMATLTFQCWFRDPACVGATSGLSGDCNDDGNATGFTLSDGYEITFTP